MSHRRLALTDKKVRNIPRRLRALAAWAADFEGYLPQGMGERGLRYEVEGWDGQTYEEERWFFGEVD